ncbi:MAG TPA: S28 family serine protease [Archangium sp.]|uniref:S28 family serine protease n=1 Tax=Archangium sp. TaxID=1872627 RepID=UPI002E35AAE3|nr:S28 family serine protease [Archangium sp.]HEX5748533.1 S28 family serine protease [Archangium sp.]
MKKQSALHLAGAVIAPLLAFQFQAHAGPAAPPPSALTAPAQGATEAVDLLERLRALPGVVSVVEGRTRIPGTRFFTLRFDQPVDHAHPEGQRFRQRVTLLHRSESRPVVLYSSGYNIPSVAFQTEPTYLFQANQLTVEHRYFWPSVPERLEWEHLNIRQAAADHHRIIQSFKGLYGSSWLTSGASKGGMTSVYHRYFYPDDVQATLPYVAPSSKGPADVRYIDFVAHAGNDPDCNERLRTFQKTALQRRDELLPLVDSTYAPQGITFHTLGRERAFEFAVVESSFYFWQYGDASNCATIPAPDAPAGELFDFLSYHADIGFNFGDDALDFFAPYYYQAATELGAPRYDERHLHGLLRFPREDRPALYTPVGVEKRFDHALMPQVERWVRTQGSHLLFMYGENDPWSTNAFEVRERNDSLRFFVPAGNHLSLLYMLPAAEQKRALDALERWMGVPIIRYPTAGLRPGEALPFSYDLPEERGMR